MNAKNARVVEYVERKLRNHALRRLSQLHGKGLCQHVVRSVRHALEITAANREIVCHIEEATGLGEADDIAARFATEGMLSRIDPECFALMLELYLLSRKGRLQGPHKLCHDILRGFTKSEGHSLPVLLSVEVSRYLLMSVSQEHFTDDDHLSMRKRLRKLADEASRLELPSSGRQIVRAWMTLDELYIAKDAAIRFGLSVHRRLIDEELRRRYRAEWHGVMMEEQ